MLDLAPLPPDPLSEPDSGSMKSLPRTSPAGGTAAAVPTGVWSRRLRLIRYHAKSSSTANGNSHDR